MSLPYEEYRPELVTLEHYAPSDVTGRTVQVAYGDMSSPVAIAGDDSSIAQRFRLNHLVKADAILLQAGPAGIHGHVQVLICRRPDGTAPIGQTQTMYNINLTAGEQLLIPCDIAIPGAADLYLYVADRGGDLDMSHWAASTRPGMTGAEAVHPSGGDYLYRGGSPASASVALNFAVVTGTVVSAWSTVKASTITMTEDYDVSDDGVLLVGTNTATLTWSWYEGDWDNTPDGFWPGQSIRAFYAGNALWRGKVTEVEQESTADPDAAAHGFGLGRRNTLTVNAIHDYWTRMVELNYWESLPEQSAKARLEQHLIAVSMPDTPESAGTAPAETSPNYSVDANGIKSGGVTNSEMIRAFSVEHRLPVRMFDIVERPDLVSAGYTVWCGIITEDDLWSLQHGLTDADGLSMYRSVRWNSRAGADSISFAPEDIATGISAEFVSGDARLLRAAWQMPYALPIPMAQPATVRSMTRTLTNETCTGSVEFHTQTPAELLADRTKVSRPRPSGPYSPSKTSSGDLTWTDCNSMFADDWYSVSDAMSQQYVSTGGDAPYNAGWADAATAITSDSDDGTVALLGLGGITYDGS